MAPGLETGRERPRKGEKSREATLEPSTLRPPTQFPGLFIITYIIPVLFLGRLPRTPAERANSHWTLPAMQFTRIPNVGVPRPKPIPTAPHHGSRHFGRGG